MTFYGTSNVELASFNPATGEEVGRVSVPPVEDVAAMVIRAQEAQVRWAQQSLEERRAALLPFGEALVKESERIGTILTREMGKPLSHGIGEVKYCGSGLAETLDELVAALTPELLEDDKVTSQLVFDPYGVCAAITPWNFPVSMPHWAVIPALMAGNAVILKPSEKTPLCAAEYAKLLQQFLPADLLQIIHGDERHGRALVAADVQLIAFTGSRTAGQNILTEAGKDLKRVILELGGKDPLIVLDDADLEAAADFAVMNSFRNSGQVCVSTERVYVQEKVADRFEELVRTKTGELVVGDGTEEKTQIGPMIDGGQRDHVLEQIEAAKRAGARVIAGDQGHHGNFVMPTVLGDVDHQMAVMVDETFGPVVGIQRVADDDDAVAAANDTPYGLGAAVFGGDLDRAEKIGRQLSAGMVGINKGCGGASGSPWVGARQSGYGYHSGRDGHRQFAQVRVVSRMK